MNVVIDHLGDVKSDVVQNRGCSERSLINNKLKVSLPQISQRYEGDHVGRSGRLLIISYVIKVHGEDGLADVINGKSGPKELRDNTLPNQSLSGTIE